MSKKSNHIPRWELSPSVSLKASLAADQQGTEEIKAACSLIFLPLSVALSRSYLESAKL